MKNFKMSANDHHSEAEAAELLGITVSRLHQLLDEHIFNDGRNRPPAIELNSTDLVLLRYWHKNPDRPQDCRVLQMPRRKK